MEGVKNATSTDLVDARLIATAQALREAIRASWFEDEARLMVAFGAWPQNVDRAQRFLDAVAAWDRLTGSHDAASVAPEPGP